MKDNAPFLDMPNNMKPENYNTHFVYGDPYKAKTNDAAKMVNKEEVMRAVMSGK